uniref:Reverse transcriptase domain-containing protein n=1 Tax=Xenopus tropicalis TaxID=8364 RepID=A0A6I8STC9_XENTR
MAVPPPIRVVTINVASVKSVGARDTAFFFLSRVEADILFLQETRLCNLQVLHRAKKEWVHGPSYWSLAAEMYSGVAVLFKTSKVTVKRVIEVEMGRCMVLDVLLNGQNLRLINVYGPQTLKARRDLFSRIKPFLFTAQPIIFGGDFNTVTRPMDRGGAAGRLGYDSIYLNSIVSQAGLEDVHIRHFPDRTGFTFYRGTCRSRIDRFFVKQDFIVSPPEVTAVEFSDHCMVSVSLNVSESPQRGRGLWRLNSALLGEECVNQSFREFFQAQESLLDLCNTKAEWWEMVKKRAAGLFRGLANKIQIDKDRAYQSLRRKLDRLVSDGAQGGEVARVRALMKEYQYDRYSSLVLERDYGKHHSPDPYQNCREVFSRKSIHGLQNEAGVLETSVPGILRVVKNYYAELLKGQGLSRASMSSFLEETPILQDENISFDELECEIGVEEVRKAIDGLGLKKSPGPDGLTAEFYKQFVDVLAPRLTEVFNSTLEEGLLPPSMRHSALILLSKGLDQSKVENWRPIALLNTDRKILAKVMFNRLFPFAERLLSPSQHCTVKGRSTFSAVLGIREVLERCRICEWGKYLLTLDQSKAFDRVNHEYLWLLLDRYGLPGKFVNWLKILYKGAESFPLVNGWSGESFGVSSGVRQGCPLNPLLYVFAIDPLIRRIECDALAGVPLSPGRALKVSAYADDVTVVVSSGEEAETVARVLRDYSRASGSLINQNKCETFWMGKGDPAFDLLDVFPVAQPKIKILGIEFGQGDYAKQIWEGKLETASVLVNRWKGLKFTLRERVDLIKTYLIPIFLYLSHVCLLPEAFYVKIKGLFFQLLWGNKTNLIKRNITYLQRKEGGLGMVNPVVFFMNTFIKYNYNNLLLEKPPLWVEIFRVWALPFLECWKRGGLVKSVRAPHAPLPPYVAVSLKVMRRWCVSVGEIRASPRRDIDRRVLGSYFHASLALKDCPDEVLRSGLSLVNSPRVPPKLRDVVWRSFHGKLYVNGNLKYRRTDDRDCPREECSGEVETMDHFLLQCPFNIDVYKQVSAALGIPCLSGCNYQEWAYGAFKRHRGYDLGTLFLVSSVVRFYTWNTRCKVSLRREVLPCPVVVDMVLGELGKIRSLERQRMDEARWKGLWRGIQFDPP